MRLWIDDVRTPPYDDRAWVWAKTSADAITIVTGCIQWIDEISFDHDLGGEDTAYPVIEYIEKYVYFNDTQYINMKVHSQNPVGRKKIQDAIDSCERIWQRKKSNG